ncbi:MAG: hypothetical protein QOG71_3911 [Pyrinomonadaceae bacterium]|nr:hypothetical protein [Pyrinomonadaceae bacterium]
MPVVIDHLRARVMPGVMLLTFVYQKMIEL